MNIAPALQGFDVFDFMKKKGIESEPGPRNFIFNGLGRDRDRIKHPDRVRIGSGLGPHQSPVSRYNMETFTL